MPARPSRYRQSKAIDQTSQNVKDRIVTKQAESKIKTAKQKATSAFVKFFRLLCENIK